MTTEKRETSVAIKCDCDHCHIEVLRRTEEQAVDEASLAGWKFNLDRDSHLCPDCQSGNCPGAAVARAKYGTDKVTIPAPGPVKKGENIAAPNGEVIGVAENDVESAGDPLVVNLVKAPDREKVFGSKPVRTSFKIEDVGVVVGGEPGQGGPVS